MTTATRPPQVLLLFIESMDGDTSKSQLPRSQRSSALADTTPGHSPPRPLPRFCQWSHTFCGSKQYVRVISKRSPGVLVTSADRWLARIAVAAAAAGTRGEA